MRHVIQENEGGCGIACVAMLAGVHYWEARLTVLGRKDRVKHTTNTKDVRDGLTYYQLGMSGLKIFNKHKWEKQKSGRFRAILRIKPRQRKSGWHWVVWDGRKVLDPLPKEERYDNALSYCTSYFKVLKIRRRARLRSRAA